MASTFDEILFSCNSYFVVMLSREGINPSQKSNNYVGLIYVFPVLLPQIRLGRLSVPSQFAFNPNKKLSDLHIRVFFICRDPPLPSVSQSEVPLRAKSARASRTAALNETSKTICIKEYILLVRSTYFITENAYRYQHIVGFPEE